MLKDSTFKPIFVYSLSVLYLLLDQVEYYSFWSHCLSVIFSCSGNNSTSCWPLLTLVSLELYVEILLHHWSPSPSSCRMGLGLHTDLAMDLNDCSIASRAVNLLCLETTSKQQSLKTTEVTASSPYYHEDFVFSYRVLYPYIVLVIVIIYGVLLLKIY